MERNSDIAMMSEEGRIIARSIGWYPDRTITSSCVSGTRIKIRFNMWIAKIVQGAAFLKENDAQEHQPTS
jgi:hypothetical protein